MKILQQRQRSVFALGFEIALDKELLTYCIIRHLSVKIKGQNWSRKDSVFENDFKVPSKVLLSVKPNFVIHVY